MPAPNACRPLALEIMSGRFPCATGAKLANVGASPPFEREPPNNFPVLAAALPASEARKIYGVTRVPSEAPPRCAHGNIQQLPFEVDEGGQKNEADFF